MNILVTGANGFIGRNLVVRLRELSDVHVLEVNRDTSSQELEEMLLSADLIFHLAGVNRPEDPADFMLGNAGFTSRVVDILTTANKRTRLVLASSIQAECDNAYGASKRAAEETVKDYARSNNVACAIYRLPNVFGKWCRPDYNSVVATFCHRIANGSSIEVNDPDRILTLAYIDDVVDELLSSVHQVHAETRLVRDIDTVYKTTVGELAQTILGFSEDRQSLKIGRVGSGLTRALYSTYISYLPESSFSYSIPSFGDQRGVFAEILKTRDSGQFSFFTAHPGVTRGGHYHHTKTEKFLVVKGRATFRFRHLITGQKCEILTSGDAPEVVETIPGWTHDITNSGTDEMIVLLWANEVFDRSKPDTIQHPIT